MVVCCLPAASSIASLTARRDAGEPSTGANIFIDKSEGLWEARCGGRHQTADLFELPPPITPSSPSEPLHAGVIWFGKDHRRQCHAHSSSLRSKCSR